MKQKWVKRIARAILPCFVFFVFSFSLAPKVYAVEADFDISYGINFWYADGRTNYALTNGTLPIVNGSADGEMSTSGLFFDARVNSYPEVQFYGPVKMYASYYPIQMTNTRYPMAVLDNYLDPSDFEVRYINTNGQEGFVVGGLDSIEEFATTASSVGKGYTISASWEGSDLMPIRALNVMRKITSQSGFTPNAGGLVTQYRMYFTSIRFITAEYNAELDALDNLASEIVAQSELLLAMKGEIVGILQDIYTMTGDIWIAQDLTNQYLAAMLPLLENIDRTTTNIYSLLSTQLRLLETAIENAADSVEVAIAAQTAAMIAYLDSVLNTGNEVPDDTYQQQQDAANILDQMESLEKPNVDTIVPEIGDYTDSGVSGVLSAIFSSNLIVTMMTLSASFAFGAYVLFGKRE